MLQQSDTLSSDLVLEVMVVINILLGTRLLLSHVMCVQVFKVKDKHEICVDIGVHRKTTLNVSSYSTVSLESTKLG